MLPASLALLQRSRTDPRLMSQALGYLQRALETGIDPDYVARDPDLSALRTRLDSARFSDRHVPPLGERSHGADWHPEQGRISHTTGRDTFGRAIDGDHDGQPGGDFTANLSKGKVTMLLATQAKAAPRTTGAAVDMVLQEASFAASPQLRRRRALGR